MLKVLPHKPSVASRRHPLSLLRHLWTLRQRPLVWPQLRRACQAGLSCPRDNYRNVYSLSLFIKIDIAFQYLQVIFFYRAAILALMLYLKQKWPHVLSKYNCEVVLSLLIGFLYWLLSCHLILWTLVIPYSLLWASYKMMNSIYIYWICFFSVCMYECCSEQHNCYFPINYQCMINAHSLNIVMDKQFSNSHLGINLNGFSNKLIYPESFFEVYLHDSFPFWSLY